MPPLAFSFQKILLLLFLLAAVQPKELPAGLLTFVNNLIPSTRFQMKLLENLVHLHPRKLHSLLHISLLSNRNQPSNPPFLLQHFYHAFWII